MPVPPRHFSVYFQISNLPNCHSFACVRHHPVAVVIAPLLSRLRPRPAQRCCERLCGRGLRVYACDVRGPQSAVQAWRWDRAAIVWAFTYKGINRFDSGKDLYRYTITAFAARGIVGLASKPTVIARRTRWAAAA